MRYEFHPEALDEYEAAAHYYAEKEPGLDLRFIVCVENAIEAILEDPLRWRPIRRGRSSLSHPSFPIRHPLHHRVGFRAHHSGCSCSREPGYWKHRIA